MNTLPKLHNARAEPKDMRMVYIYHIGFNMALLENTRNLCLILGVTENVIQPFQQFSLKLHADVVDCCVLHTGSHLS